MVSIINYISSCVRRKLLRGLPGFGFQSNQLVQFTQGRSRSGGAAGEEIPLVLGKEQQLRFAGTAVKRYPTSKVRENNARFIK